MLSSFIIFTLFTLACAVAPNWPSFLVFRLICGIMASSPIAVIGGIFADIFNDPVTRGRAVSMFMTVSLSCTRNSEMLTASRPQPSGRNWHLSYQALSLLLLGDGHIGWVSSSLVSV